MMASGVSLHIGVNTVDPVHYDGWSGPLEFCEADAEVLKKLANDAGFKTTTLKSPDATRDNVIGAIEQAAATLTSGDMFLLTYAGHGGQITDIDGDEEDQLDETWCLFDGQLIDDELNILWAKFAAGVRVLVLSDSCHSGSVAKDVSFSGNAMSQQNAFFSPKAPVSNATFRFMPRDAAVGTQRKNRGFYWSLQEARPSLSPEIKATVRLLSGCQDNQLSSEVDGNGVFTRHVVQTWNKGEFSGDYAKFHQEIMLKMNKNQQPNHMIIGAPSSEYDQQKPFTVLQN
jgi:hypothetical protein